MILLRGYFFKHGSLMLAVFCLMWLIMISLFMVMVNTTDLIMSLDLCKTSKSYPNYNSILFRSLLAISRDKVRFLVFITYFQGVFNFQKWMLIFNSFRLNIEKNTYYLTWNKYIHSSLLQGVRVPFFTF